MCLRSQRYGAKLSQAKTMVWQKDESQALPTCARDAASAVEEIATSSVETGRPDSEAVSVAVTVAPLLWKHVPTYKKAMTSV